MLAIAGAALGCSAGIVDAAGGGAVCESVAGGAGVSGAAVELASGAAGAAGASGVAGGVAVASAGGAAGGASIGAFWANAALPSKMPMIRGVIRIFSSCTN